MSRSAAAALLEPVRARRHSRYPTILALARVETVRLTRHPAFLVGLAATLIAISLRSDEDPYVRVAAWGFTWMGTLVAAALVAGRQRFLNDPDLFPATPATPGDRVLATTVALMGPTLAVALAMVVALAIHDGSLVVGEGGYYREVSVAAAVWLQAVLLVVLSGVVGIVVAQLRRGRLAVLVLLMFFMFVGGAWVWAFQAHPFRVLHPFMYPSYEVELPTSFTAEGWSVGDPPLNPPDQYNRRWREIRFDTAALNWHLLYVAGLILFGTWWARRSPDRREGAGGRWLLMAAVPPMLAGGIAQIVTAGVNP